MKLFSVLAHYKNNPIWRLFKSYVLPQWPILIVAFLTNLAAAISTGSIPALTKRAIDTGTLTADAKSALIVGVVITLLVVVRALFMYMGAVSIAYLGQRMSERLQADFFDKILQSDLPFVTNQHSGHFLSQFSVDIQRLQAILLSSALNFFQNIFTVIVLFIGLFFLNPKLAFLGTIAAPSATILSRVLRTAAKKQAHKNLYGLATLTTLLSEILAGFRVVKAYCQERYESDRCRRIVRDIRRNGLRAVMINSVAGPFVEMLSGLGLALVVCFAGMEIRSGNITLGQLTAFLISLPLAYQPLKSIMGQQIALQDGVAISERILSVLDHKNHFQDVEGAKPLVLNDAHIVFQNVSFSYLNTPYATVALSEDKDNLIIKDVVFELSRGKTIALVGASGAGKSTILNLLLRFYSPLSGTITIDGQDIASVTLESLRSSMALVTQDPFLFDDTIEANIAYGAPGGQISFEKIVEAAQFAYAHDFIIEQPLGYKTRVGQAGVHLSGGQKQRIAIARAMVKNAPILLLDEATSSLDSYSEMQVQKALTHLMQGRSTLVIAHRLSTVIHADEIYVLNKGRIAEHGTHQDLMEKGGIYARLYSLQLDQNHGVPLDEQNTHNGNPFVQQINSV